MHEGLLAVDELEGLERILSPFRETHERGACLSRCRDMSMLLRLWLPDWYQGGADGDLYHVTPSRVFTTTCSPELWSSMPLRVPMYLKWSQGIHGRGRAAVHLVHAKS